MRAVKTEAYTNSVNIAFGADSIWYTVPVTVKAGISLKAGALIAGEGGTIKAGTATVVVATNDATTEGVLLHDVDATDGALAGTMVIAGILDLAKVTTGNGAAPAGTVAIPLVQFRKTVNA
jgi:hypothetical protein